jgi:hypothetical protein
MNLKRFLLLFFASFILSTGYSQKLLSQSVINSLSFESFPVEKIICNSSAPINLSNNSNAYKFRTVLTEGAKQGVNFAGHYTIVTWGCGTSCQVLAVIDRQTGQVYFPEIVASVGFDYKIDSSLLIVNPSQNLQKVPEQYRQTYGETTYYKWENNQFIPLSNFHKN